MKCWYKMLTFLENIWYSLNQQIQILKSSIGKGLILSKAHPTKTFKYNAHPTKTFKTINQQSSEQLNLLLSHSSLQTKLKTTNEIPLAAKKCFLQISLTCFSFFFFCLSATIIFRLLFPKSFSLPGCKCSVPLPSMFPVGPLLISCYYYCQTVKPFPTLPVRTDVVWLNKKIIKQTSYLEAKIFE